MKRHGEVGMKTHALHRSKLAVVYMIMTMTMADKKPAIRRA